MWDSIATCSSLTLFQDKDCYVYCMVAVNAGSETRRPPGSCQVLLGLYMSSILGYLSPTSLLYDSYILGSLAS